MNADEGQRKLAAILAADVAGYSRLMADDEQATVRTLTLCRNVFSSYVAQHNGRIIDTAGDSVLATFDSVVEAVEAAIEVQRELTKENEALAEHRRMRFRIGVNLGDIIVREDGTVYGDGVNVAARLESLSKPGGVMISESAYMQVEGKLDIAMDAAGEHDVKNIPRPVRAYRVLETGETLASGMRTFLPRTAAGVGTAVIALLVSAVTWLSFVYLAEEPMLTVDGKVTDDPVLAMPTGPSIAVLPFDNLSGDADQEYFADGFTDTLITDLSKLWELAVISSNSTFTYKGRTIDVRDIGKELGVTHVLDGSILRTDERLRVNVQLINAASGEHVWANRYDRPVADVFDVQDEIVRAVVSELDVVLTSDDQARIWRRSTNSPEAYDFFLQATAIQGRFGKENTARAQKLLQDALDVDPNFAAAMSLQGNTYYNQAVAGWSTSFSETLDAAERRFIRATELDDSLGDAYGMLGVVYLVKLDHVKALSFARQAVAVTPGAADTLAYASVVYIYSGMPERGLELIDKATQLDPFPHAWFDHPRGAARIFLGDYRGALKHYRTCVETLPDYIWCNVNIIVPYVELGMMNEARAQAREVMRINPAFDTRDAIQLKRIRDADTRTLWQKRLSEAGLP